MSADLRTAIAEARARLMRAGIASEEATASARVLAERVLGWDRAQVLTHDHLPPPAGFPPHYEALIARRAAREPLAYITGDRAFWDVTIAVTPDVLIPRPETELIVEAAVGTWPREAALRILDVGTGSGCLAVVLARLFPHAQVIATDLSAAALVVAATNARRLGVRDRVRFVQADLLSGLRGRFDLVVSNPPYIPLTDAATLSPDVAEHEPSSALFSGPDGLTAIRQLLRALPQALAPGGRCLLECGLGQDAAIEALCAHARLRLVTWVVDLQQIRRVAVIEAAALASDTTSVM